MALHTDLDHHLRAVVGSSYTVTGTSATITGTLTHSRLAELIDKAQVTNHNLSLAAGVLTLAPR